MQPSAGTQMDRGEFLRLHPKERMAFFAKWVEEGVATPLGAELLICTLLDDFVGAKSAKAAFDKFRWLADEAEPVEMFRRSTPRVLRFFRDGAEWGEFRQEILDLLTARLEEAGYVLRWAENIFGMVGVRNSGKVGCPRGVILPSNGRTLGLHPGDGVIYLRNAVDWAKKGQRGQARRGHAEFLLLDFYDPRRAQ